MVRERVGIIRVQDRETNFKDGERDISGTQTYLRYLRYLSIQ